MPIKTESTGNHSMAGKWGKIEKNPHAGRTEGREELVQLNA